MPHRSRNTCNGRPGAGAEAACIHKLYSRMNFLPGHTGLGSLAMVGQGQGQGQGQHTSTSLLNNGFISVTTGL